MNRREFTIGMLALPVMVRMSSPGLSVEMRQYDIPLSVQQLINAGYCTHCSAHNTPGHLCVMDGYDECFDLR